MNTDVEPIKGFLAPMLPHFFKNGDVFADGAQLKGYDHKIQDAGKWPDLRWTEIRSTRGLLPFHDQAVAAWFCLATCCLYDAQKFKMLGGFDELFNPYYYEDADLCIWAWCAGWKSIYEPRAQAFRPNPVTIKKHHSADWIKIIANRNMLLLNFRHLKGWQIPIFTLLLVMKFMTACWVKRWS